MKTQEIMALADAWRIASASNVQCDDASLAYIENKRLALQSAIEALQADAARYRWLRDPNNGLAITLIGSLGLEDDADLDSAIDQYLTSGASPHRAWCRT